MAIGGRDEVVCALRVMSTGAPDGLFPAERHFPRPLLGQPAQNWWAPDVETLWAAPMVGGSGPTVGDDVTAMLRPDGRFIRPPEGLGSGLGGAHGVLATPVVGPWLLGRCCPAYHRGFVEPLARDPGAVVPGPRRELRRRPGDSPLTRARG